VYALVSLTVARMVPVAIALVGTGLDRRTVAFIGWFGPRGLASVVFSLLAYDALAGQDGRVTLTIVTLTVVFSVILHGASALPLIRRYQRAEDSPPVASPGKGDETPTAR